jgi:hypothetical protein
VAIFTWEMSVACFFCHELHELSRIIFDVTIRVIRVIRGDFSLGDVRSVFFLPRIARIFTTAHSVATTDL